MYIFLKKFPFPLVIVVAYIFIGILCHVWHPTWMMFLLIPAYYLILFAIGKEKKGAGTKEVLLAFPFPALIIIIYLCMGFFLHLWHPGWLVFLLIPVYYAMIPMLADKE